MSDAAARFPDSEICEACKGRFAITTMHLTDDPCLLCDDCYGELLEDEARRAAETRDYIGPRNEFGDPFCPECGGVPLAGIEIEHSSNCSAGAGPTGGDR